MLLHVIHRIIIIIIIIIIRQFVRRRNMPVDTTTMFVNRDRTNVMSELLSVKSCCMELSIISDAEMHAPVVTFLTTVLSF